MFEWHACEIRVPGSDPLSLGRCLSFVSAPRQGQKTESHREEQGGNAAEPTTLRWPVMFQYLVPVDRCRNTDHFCRRPEAVDVSRHRSPANSRSCSNGTRARFGFRVPTLCRLAAASALLVHLASQQTRRTSSFLIFGNRSGCSTGSIPVSSTALMGPWISLGRRDAPPSALRIRLSLVWPIPPEGRRWGQSLYSESALVGFWRNRQRPILQR